MATSKATGLSNLQGHLALASNRPRARDIPSLTKPLRAQATNCIRFSAENNDLLEFLGDRLVNLITALIVEEIKVDKCHHTAVRSVICNNDTFGRISYYLRLDQGATLSPQDIKEVERWNPLQPGTRPPKVLADLFEAVVGAVFLQHGFLALDNWLRTIFEPILKAATKDYWYSTTRTLAFCRDHRTLTFNGAPYVQQELVDYICFERDIFEDLLSGALYTLPKNTVFYFDEHGYLEEPDNERLEVATHFLNLSICHTIIRIWPQYGHARAKAAHLASTLTELVSSDFSLSYLASTLPLTTHFNGDMKQAERRSSKLYQLPGSAHQLALVFKATIGWYYRAHPRSSASWAYEWLKPLVTKAHDLLVEDSWYQPIVPQKDDLDGEGPSEAPSTGPDPHEEEEDALSNLSGSLRNLQIKEPAAQRRIGIRVSSTLVSKLNSSNHLQMHNVPGREGQTTYTIDDSPEHAPPPRGWTRMFPSKP